MNLKLNIKDKFNKKYYRIEQSIWRALGGLLFSFFVVLLITLFSPLNKEFSLEVYASVLFRNTVVFYSLGSFLLIFKRGWFYFSVYGVMWILISIANSLVNEFRGTPLTKYDFLMIKEGFSLSKDFLNTSDFIKIGFIVSILILFLIAIFIISKRFKKLTKSNWLITLGLGLYIFSISPVDTSVKSLENIGFVNYFLNNLISSEVKKPSNYNKDTINNIKNSISGVNNNILSEDKKPNIVAIQLESFFDPKTLNGLELNQNPIPYFDELRENFSHGYVDVPTFGGGTARSEFEFLTTINLDPFTNGIIPHNTFLRNKTVSNIPYLLRKNGYKTHLVHNYLGDFYNRDLVYKNLGFDTFTSKELIYYSSWDPLLLKASNDDVFVREVPNILSLDNGRDFVFAITTQLHGPYYDTYNAHENGIYATGNFPKKMLGEMNEYVNKIKTIDDVIKGLVEKLESINEPTIAIFYSDHLPGFDFSSTNLENAQYKSPYVVWDNIGLKKEVKNLELSDLMLECLTKANVSLGNLTNLYKKYSKTNEYQEYKELINYDMSFGKNYIEEVKFDKVDTKMGHRSIYVEKAIKTSDNEYTINGWNYTEYTKLICEGKEYDIEYGGPAEVKVKTNDNLLGKKAYLQTQIGKRKSSVAKSETFTIKKES